MQRWIPLRSFRLLQYKKLLDETYNGTVIYQEGGFCSPVRVHPATYTNFYITLPQKSLITLQGHDMQRSDSKGVANSGQEHHAK